MNQKNQTMTAEQALERYADMVYRLALAEVKNKTDADDIFQEVFVRLVGNIHKLSSEEHIKAWLIRVTINCSRKLFSSYWKKNVDFFEEETELGAESKELANLLDKDSPVLAAVHKLPEKYRVIVHLFYFEEFSVQEIQKILRLKESTVKSQLFRARQMLKEMLEGKVDL